MLGQLGRTEEHKPINEIGKPELGFSVSGRGHGIVQHTMVNEGRIWRSSFHRTRFVSARCSATVNSFENAGATSTSIVVDMRRGGDDDPANLRT